MGYNGRTTWAASVEIGLNADLGTVIKYRTALPPVALFSMPACVILSLSQQAFPPTDVSALFLSLIQK
jgi:hypothetical protein